MHSRMLTSVEKLSNYPSFFKFLDSQFNEDYNILKTTLFENSINSPIGLAAGFDKDAKIINALFGYGSFTIENINMTSLALKYFGYGVPAFALIKILSNANY